MALKTILECMFSPKLIKINGNDHVQKIYQPELLERWSDKIIYSVYMVWKIGVYTSPALIGFLYQKGYHETDGLITITKFLTGVGVILVISFCFRALGRASNPTYKNFLSTLQAAQKNMTPVVKKQLNKYDFEFRAWPVEYRSPTNRSCGNLFKSNIYSWPQFLFLIPYKILAYGAIHTFGIRLIYPGTIRVLQMMLDYSLMQGRSRLVDLFNGERFKIQTADNNEVDTMFIDRRNKSPNGNTLVICCEGNAGFYEIGITITPLEAGYSVLGWNHPGFGGSTGMPYPAQEQCAIDAVMQFAINKLNFKPENIVLFGWSIGGYISSWAGMTYPDIKGLILDATFDDILPIAVNQMPKWIEPIVNVAIREHVNLHVSELLSKYPGPVLVYRRTNDEVMCLKENDLSSNRGNELLLKLFSYRYPHIFEETQKELVFRYLSVPPAQQGEHLRNYSVDEQLSNSLLQSYVSEYSKSYPMKFGEHFSVDEKSRMALFLTKKYLKDFNATHCSNLPADIFQMPWDVNVESDFVFT